MDRDVRLIVELLYTRVREAIELHRGALEALAEALLDRETLEGNEALSILRLTACRWRRPSAAGPWTTGSAAPGARA
jgi:cell division protease FtsH